MTNFSIPLAGGSITLIQFAEYLCGTMAEGFAPESTPLMAKLDAILEILKRIEDRQIKTTAMVSEVKEKEVETPVVGSFGTVDTGKG